MKNIVLLISAVFVLTSCVGKYVEVRLLPSDSDDNYYEDEKANISEINQFNNIEVIDNRNNQELIGTKEYGEESMEIVNSQDLADLIKEEIIGNLQANNQMIHPSQTLRITLETIKYNSQRGFLIGKSRVKISLKAVLTENNNHTKYGKMYNLENERSHFIISLERTDQKTISAALRDVIDRIIEDGKLQESLIDPENSIENEQ